MNFRIPWSHSTPIGVDLAGRWIKAAQATVSSRGVRRLDLFAKAARPAEPARSAPLTADDADLLAGMLERTGFRGVSVVLGVARDLLATGALELPPRASGTFLNDIARVELARTHRIEPERLEVSMWEVPPPARSQPGTYVIAAALVPGALDPFLDVLDARGIEVVAVDMRPIALVRAAHALLAPDGMTCLVEANWHGLSIAFVLNGIVAVERFVEHVNWASVCLEGARRAGCSPNAVHEVLMHPANAAPSSLLSSCRALATEYFESICPEVMRSLSYATHRYPSAPIRTVLLAGDAAAAPGLAERLSSSLSVPLQVVSPDRMVSCPVGTAVMQADPSFAVAVGLALHGERLRARRAA
jgi:Tfp pilus assembly PilM family ATPase